LLIIARIKIRLILEDKCRDLDFIKGLRRTASVISAVHCDVVKLPLDPEVCNNKLYHLTR